MGINSGDGYYQERDEDAYLDSWEFQRDQDRLDGIERPDSYYRSRHVPVKRALLTALATRKARYEAEKMAEKLGGKLSADGKTIIVPVANAPVMTDTAKVEAKSRYEINKSAKVGETIECACCGKQIKKTNYQQAFCPPINTRRGKRYKCKDQYWNSTDPERAARANIWGGGR